MDKFSVISKGDSGDDYKIDFSCEGSKLFVNCDCMAGKNRQRCKHVLEVLSGDFSRIESEKDISLIENLFKSINLLPYDDELQDELQEIEEMEENLRVRRRSLKKKMDSLFFKGIPFENA